MFEMDKQGLWECYQLEDDTIILVDMVQDPYLNTKLNRVCGKKIKKKLGFATDRRSAYNMYQQFKNGFVDNEVELEQHIDDGINIGYWKYRSK